MDYPEAVSYLDRHIDRGGGWLVTIEGAETTYEDLFLPIPGRYQLTNLAVAVAADYDDHDYGADDQYESRGG